MLTNKTAVIYGATGSLGSAVAKAMAAAGAKVFVTGRNENKLKDLVHEILSNKGSAQYAIVDAMNESAVADHLESILETGNTVDVSFNATGSEVVQNIPLTEISVEDFMHPVSFMAKTQFITQTAAARVMSKQGSGVILSLTATPGGIGYPYTAGFAIACTALETLSKNLAGEIGQYGVRAVNIRSGGSPDSAVFKAAREQVPEIIEPILKQMKNDTMLKDLPLMADIANVAVFLASDLAAKITGVTIDVTAGTTSGLNYRAPGARTIDK
ncbi:MAG: SDR family oxidoreductase [Flavitalea sp.]